MASLTASVTGAAAVVILYWPHINFHPDDERIFSQGLRIQLDRSSPAFAALEDTVLGTQLAVFEPPVIFEPSIVNMLEAGARSAESLARMIVRENKRESTLMAQARAAHARITHETAPQRPVAPGRESEVFQHPPMTLSLSELKISREELIRGLLAPIVNAHEGEGTPAAGPLLASGGFPSGGSRPAKPPQLGGLVPKGPPSAAMGRRRSSGSPEADSAVRTVKEDAKRDGRGNVNSYGFDAGSDPERDAAAAARRETNRQLVVSGPIEFIGGLAITNPADRVVVYREADGQLFEAGAIWLREGRYEIFVDRTEGLLIGELRTRGGDILGRGQYDLVDLPSIYPSQYRVDDVPIKIRPVVSGVSGRVIAGADAKATAVRGARVQFQHLPFEAVSLKEGRFQEPNLVEGSSVILRASRPAHWGSMMFASAGSEARVPLFSDKVMTAFTTLAGSRTKASAEEDESVVWGRVVSGGGPVAGAQVELMTTTEVIRPVYFNAMMIPDPALTATSGNGLYAFYPVTPGAHAVQAVLGERTSEPVLFPADARTVSNVEIEITSSQRANVRVFDAFRTDQPLAADIGSPGSLRTLKIDHTGAGVLGYSTGGGMMVLDSDAGSRYQKTRVSFNRDRRFVYLPMIQTLWLEQIRSSMRLNTELSTGVVVGFIQGSARYQVQFAEQNILSGTRIVYFNPRGELTRKNVGDPGGGFIAFNVPEGFRTIGIQQEDATKIFSATVLVDSKVTNVVNHWFR